MNILEIIILCAFSAAGSAGLIGLISLMMSGRKRKKGSSQGQKKRLGTMDIILIIIGGCLLLFTIEMIRIFQKYGAIPDTLVTCVFAALGGECGIMGWIKTTKERKQERKWQLDDENRMNEQRNKEKEEKHEIRTKTDKTNRRE